MVVLRGWYTKLTVCLYGYFTSIQEVPAAVPTTEPQLNPPVVDDKAGTVSEPQGMERVFILDFFISGFQILEGEYPLTTQKINPKTCPYMYFLAHHPVNIC